MRYLLFFAVHLLLVATGCKKSTPTPLTAFPDPSGTYTGTFQREPGGQIAQVSLAFSGGEWSGTSQIRRYPGLCSGTYSVSGNNKITFTNACVWTADFDWTLILAGDYDLNTTDNVLEISKQASNARDVYRLSK